MLVEKLSIGQLRGVSLHHASQVEFAPICFVSLKVIREGLLTRASATLIVDELAKTNNRCSTMDALECLRNMTGDELVTAAFSSGVIFWPTTDGEYLLEDSLQLLHDYQRYPDTQHCNWLYKSVQMCVLCKTHSKLIYMLVCCIMCDDCFHEIIFSVYA